MPERATKALNPHIDLDAQLLAAHGCGDAARLALLYNQAAQTMAERGETDAAAFFMTHAYVFALDSGLAEAADCANWLRAHQRL
jgi:hypothetical protein